MYRVLLSLICGIFLVAAGPCGELMPEESENLADAGAICTQIACADAFIVEIIRADNAEFQPGEYLFEIAAPEDMSWSIACYFGFGEAGLDCSTGDILQLDGRLFEDGHAMELKLSAAPQSAAVSVIYNGAEIGSRNFVPIYESFMPNGPECPPTCLLAEEVMAVQSW